MAQGERQQESLETLKLINAASTSLRLYPEDSPQVANSIENAYQGTKRYLRNNKLLRFSVMNGDFALNGEPVDNPTRERLQLLTFSDQLQRMELEEFVLCKGFDRQVFRKILTVFSATPEQINSAGGNRAFVEETGLAATFPKVYFAPGESDKEIQQKKKIDQILKDLSGGFVRPEYILYLVGRKNEDSIKQVLQQSFQSPENACHIVAATTYSLVQILNKDHVVAVAPAFTKVLETVNSLLEESLHQKVSAKAATLLAPHLDETSVLMLICQDFSTPFADYFYDALLTVTDMDTLTKVLSWIREQQQKGGDGSDKLAEQLRVVTKGADKLLATSRGKQITALGATKKILEKTERGRKEQRVQTGITALAKGDLSSLNNEEVCRSLPATIEKLLNNEKEPVAAAILQNVVKGLKTQEHDYREGLAQIIGGVAYKLVQMERWGWLEKLTPVCLAWMRETETANRSFEHHVRSMQAMMNYAWSVDHLELAEHILNVFYHIRSGALEKSDAVCKMLGRIQDENVDLALLQGYLDRCFVKPVNEMICRKIVMQGPIAARFLLDTLITSENRSHRIRLLKILAEMSDALVPVLLERLPDPMPWFGKRNIIRLLAETGSEEDVPAVLDYVSHEDLRVQQETLQCIVRIGKKSTESYLLQILPLTGVQLKAQTLKNLGRVATEAVVAPLAALLEECKLYRGSEKKILALEIVRTLEASRAAKAFPVLQKVIDEGEKQYTKESVDAAKLAISYIQEKGNGANGAVIVEAEAQKAPLQESVASAPVKPAPVTPTLTPVAPTPSSIPSPATPAYDLVSCFPEEKDIYTLLKKDKKNSATRLIVELIGKAAHLKKFNDAELLRLRLIDIDPMALSQIIQAAELIEDAKSNSVDKNHILIWSDLYDLLSTEEFNAFYHSLKHENCAAESVIVKQGDPQSRLFFVNKGRVKLFYNERDSEMLVKTISHGNVFGGNSFFDDSVWTLSAASMGAVEFSTLSMSCVEEWREQYPSLEAKLQEYCLEFDRVNDFFITSGAERREDERISFSGVAHFTVLDEQERFASTTIRGEYSDISVGGLSLYSRITQRTQARSLLGRHVEVSLQDNAKTKNIIKLTGMVVAVHNLHSVELGRSVHVSFDSPITAGKMMEIVNGQ